MIRIAKFLKKVFISSPEITAMLDHIIALRITNNMMKERIKKLKTELKSFK